jgi:hypothetical protein
VRAERQPALAPDSAAMLQLGLSEQERAAKGLARAQDLLTLGAPLIISRQLAEKGDPAEVARLQDLGRRWLSLQPEVLAIAAGYPSAAVRANVGRFIELVGGVFAANAVVLTDPDRVLAEPGGAEWVSAATAAFEALDVCWRDLIVSLHAGEPSAAGQPGAADRQEPVESGEADAEAIGDLTDWSSFGEHPARNLDPLGDHDRPTADPLTRHAGGGQSGNRSPPDQVSLKLGECSEFAKR